MPAWSPPFLPYSDDNQYSTNIQENAYYPFQYGMRPLTPHIATSSTTSAIQGRDDTPDRRETDACTSTRVYEENKEDALDPRAPNDGTTSNPDEEQIDGGDLIEEPQSGMEFNSFEDLLSYYKGYGKRCGFGVSRQRSERGEDKSMRYVTLDCARGGKARNKSFNVANLRPTGKNDCKAKINTLKVEGKMWYSGGTGALRDYFLRMQYKSNGFFASMNLDDDEMLKNVFWADPRSRKVPEKLGSYASYKTGLKNHLMKCVYDTQSFEEFETYWDGLLNTYDLHDNVWLKSLYVNREHWVPVFLKEYFWAGMSTTQRSESMNAFFDGYVHAMTNLKEFVDQFDSALKKKIENKMSADFHSFSVTIPYVSRSPIEKRFQELYTNAKFREVQQQVIGVLDLDSSLLRLDGVMKTYLVEDKVRVEEFTKPITYSVAFNKEDCSVKCSYGLFQTMSILCRHILAIFKSNGVKSLLDRYILDRRRKDIKRRYTLIQRGYDVGDQSIGGNRYSILLNICYQMIIYEASLNEQFEDAKTRIHQMTNSYRENPHPQSWTQTGSNTGAISLDTSVHVGSSQQVKSPLIVRGK
ncbi:protein FAR1-RELATED SEQUENCE 1-like [Carya illinoinensis]|uniref:protein FAR1-RELATED SEQUENCE 1-like n=1 Tax=Carya illinoinensis TaxID=32201 RepID=UPI001C7187C2|nr:protein FAR1-RELATED SEQUENCE 1-like [Carya illinoinensis]